MNTGMKNNMDKAPKQLPERSHHWETAVTKKSVVFVPLYTLCGKVQYCTEGLQVMYIVTKKIFITFYYLIRNDRFVTSITSLQITDL